VNPGVYNETVALPQRTGLTILGQPGAIMDGGGTLGGCFNVNNSSAFNYTIDGFEIRNYLTRGITLSGGAGTYTNTNHRITNNYIHDIIAQSSSNSYAIYCSGGNPTITGNAIHDVGWIGESTGIWTGLCHDHLIDDNQIWNVRKEGIRDWRGLRPTITNNRVTSIGFAGIANNLSLSPLVANNMMSFCHNGFDSKHVNVALGSYAGSPYDYWPNEDPDTIVWGRYWHNTMWRCRHASFLMDGQPGVKIDIRNNIFGGRGSAQRSGKPSDLESIVDYNVYDTSDPAGFLWEMPYQTYGSTAKTLQQLRDDLGHELHGSQLDAQINDPLHGDLDYPDTSPVVGTGAALDSAWGNQVGARGLSPRKVWWTPAPKTVLDAKSKGYAPTFTGHLATNDEKSVSSLTTGNPPGTGGASNEWITYDLGSEVTFNQITLSVHEHARTYNVKRFTLETGTTSTGPWTVVLDFGAAYTDSNLSGFPIKLSEPATARYVRFTAVTNFGNLNWMVINDVLLGTITEFPDEVPPPEPAPVTLWLGSLPVRLPGNQQLKAG
jgi:hypothetical protein